MTDEPRESMLHLIELGRNYLRSHEEFFRDDEMRGVFVVLLALEGAIMFSNVEELAMCCVEFSKRKQVEIKADECVDDCDDQAAAEIY